jgi:hypothetical protein
LPPQVYLGLTTKKHHDPMKKLFSIGYAISAGLVAAMLVGCGASQAPLGASNVIPQSHAIGAQSGRSGSWMLPEAKHDDLLYAGALLGDQVTVFSYPSGKLVGTLEPGVTPAGECSDRNGDVFIAGGASEAIEEYAHGGTTPIQTLNNAPYWPVSCSVDPITGNLATANMRGPSSRGFGSISIFQGASGTPTFYEDPNIYWYYNCGYDDDGNLFTDGNNESAPPPFAELPRGSGTFTNITLSQGLADGGPIQWDGSHLAVGYGDHAGSVIYQVTISGSVGTVVGTTSLQSPREDNAFSFWVAGQTIVSAYQTRRNRYRRIGIWAYPAGGEPEKHIDSVASGQSFWAVTVSVAHGHAARSR